jgi:CheY-like chemotaxis protein
VALTVAIDSRDGDFVMLHVTVRDTGVGIAPEKQELIFEAFSQEDVSTTRRYGGTGLGLTISARLVEMMGGKIWVESKQGVGSTFHFTCKLAAGKPKPDTSLPTMTESLAGITVLLVVQNASSRQALHTLVTSWDMKTTVTTEVPAAVEVLRSSAPDAFAVILCDAHMSGASGFALAAKLSNEPHLSSAKMILLISAGQRGDAARCRGLGVAGYLSKPVRQAELSGAIMRVLSSALHESAQPVTRHSIREDVALRRRVLVAEDNLVNQKMIQRLIEKQGHSVVLVDTGRKAVTAVEEGAFDMVFMDVQMPEMDGLEATAEIRRREQITGKHQLIIAMTAHALKGDRERCLEAGMDDYLTKPVRIDKLNAVLNGPALAVIE